MIIPKYHIFSGSQGKAALWLDSVEGLEAAQQRMTQLSAQFPGRYFIFSTHIFQALASVDTSSAKRKAIQPIIETPQVCTVK